MANAGSFSVLTTDQTALQDDWSEFLSDQNVLCPVVVSTTGTPPSTQLACTATTFWQLKFTTSANATRFTDTDPLPAPEQDDVLFGLDPAAVLQNVPLLSLLNAFTGSDVRDGGIISTVLDNISQNRTDVNLDLDTSEPRNAFWCSPGQRLSVCTALVFQLSANTGLLDTILQNVSGSLHTEYSITLSKLESLKFYCQQVSYGVKTTDGTGNVTWTVKTSYSFTIRATVDNFDFWLRLDSGGVSVSVTQDPADKTDIWQKIAALGAPATSSTQPSIGGSILNHIDILSFSLGKDFSGTTWWKIRMVLGWDKHSGDTKAVLIGLTYDSLSSTFTGTLVDRSYFMTDIRLPSYDPVYAVLPRTLAATIDDVPLNWTLDDLFDDTISLPSTIPKVIESAFMGYTKSTTSSTFFFSTTITQPTPPDPSNAVPAPFTWDDLSVTAVISDTTSLQVHSDFTLSPRAKETFSPARIAIDLSYVSGSWQLAGYVTNLQMGLLLGFFDPDLNGPLVEILGQLTLSELDIIYTYSSKLATSFLLSGTITLGALELRLFYQYASSAATVGQSAADLGHKTGDPSVQPKPTSGSMWSFQASLGTTGQTANIGEIMDSIVPNASSSIPDFVRLIDVAPAASDQSPILLLVGKTTSNGTSSAVFVLDINILGVKLSVFQVASAGKTRRIFRLSVDKIPFIDTIPLIDKLPQPFDQLMYMWVTGDGDLTQADVAAINSVLPTSVDQLLYKQTVKPDDVEAIALAAGHHFIVINNGTVALDHVFSIAKDENTAGSPPSTAGSGQSTTTLVKATKGADGGTTDDPPENAPTKGALAKTLGPLSISAVTLQYKNKVLSVTMDAVLTLGPISLGLLGFSIGVPTTGLRLNNLAGIASSIQWNLDGMSVAFNQPPLLVAGSFEHDIIPFGTGTENVYKGGVGISFPPYTFVGVGEYATVTDAGSSYKSVFLYAKLDGPLIDLEFAIITGARLGFGFNSIVRSPSIDEITDFPFINDAGASGAGNDPRLILQAMDPKWVTPKESSYWFAVGLTATAFDVLAVTAVALFSFRDAGVIIGIYADAIAQMPPGESNRDALALYVEIGIVAEMNFIDGYFRVEASLAPTSFLLTPDCHLTGGFALVTWFGVSI